MIAKWAQEDVETLDNLLNNNYNIGTVGASGWLFKKKSITMHGNMNVKFQLPSVKLVLLMYVSVVTKMWGRAGIQV